MPAVLSQSCDISSPYAPSNTFSATRPDMSKSSSFMGSIRRLSRSNDTSEHPQQQTEATRRPTGRNLMPWTRSADAPPPSYEQALIQPAHDPSTQPSSPRSPQVGEEAQQPQRPVEQHPAFRPQRQTQPEPARNVEDTQYSFLSQFDTIFVIDDSGTMNENDGSGPSRWEQTENVIAHIAPVCTKYDHNGIDIRFLNSQVEGNNIKTAQEAREVFSTLRDPSGRTDTGTKLFEILSVHLDELAAAKSGKPKPKPLNIIVITDGIASDDPGSVVEFVARELDALRAIPWQVGIQFIQVGSDEAAAAELKHLDEDLSRKNAGKPFRDIVDTVDGKGMDGRLSDSTILKMVMGAINRRLDNRPQSPA